MIAWNDKSLQVSSDDAKRAKYRALQSWYREHVLELPPGQDKREIIRGSMIPASAPRSTNFLSAEVYEYVQARVPVVVGEGGTLEEDRLYRNMLSSMPMCFNIFGMFRVFPITAAEVLASCTGLDIAALVDVQVEWTPVGDHPLGDRTAFDAWVEYRTSENRRGFLGVETKYTEPFSQREYRNDKYDAWTDSPKSGFAAGAADVLVKKTTNQLWRNCLLAVAVHDVSEFDEGRVLVLALDGDSGAERALEGVRSQHGDPGQLLSHVTLEALASRAGQTEALADWGREFQRRYLELPL